MKHILIGAAAAGVLFACGGKQEPQIELAPAISAYPVGAAGTAAVDTVTGVRLQARAEAWTWMPDLAGKATPMLLNIENNGKAPVLVRLNKLRITGPSGQVYSGMPPYRLGSTVSEAWTVRTPVYPATGFSVAPYLRYYYPTLTPYDGPFAADSAYYNRYLPTFQRLELPSTDMIHRSLPEGVLEPGGKVSGFVYFEPISHEVMPLLDLSFEIVNPDTNQQIGKATIPFVARIRR